ncbi:beta-ketoacyl-ACP synthase I [Pseudomarimonas arenosa]|uniref:3-oxoacyl-[acyl-carrier-protein] synthase 1 n=1 Tax=Pseudomarimonas arenosa TaxID=2774145 RepID=A0AAW3ZIS0_9GAMM|nr:beta-ketoacyl-ACP synthase I [Pseudomarimonas arenosa]MBD8525960.1 beta-ketoacyl-ACP synthase I [Pseudomarimonas arenosa]
MAPRRVVVTGFGIVSCLGNDEASVVDALKHGRSGIRIDAEAVEFGLRSHMAGRPQIDLEARIDRKARRFMADAAAYAHVALDEAIAMSGLPPETVSNVRTGLMMGSGGASSLAQSEACDTLRAKGVRRVGAYGVTKTMSSTVSACLSTAFKIKGLNYSIASACATSAHCIGVSAQQIRWGEQDVMFAGGGEELSWAMSCLFDGMGALSTNNEQAETASRPYDAGRDGFVIAGGGGVLVLESLEHAQARGANILAELVGFGASSDGADMVAPSGEGAVRCMRQALAGLPGSVDYINTHGTSTPVGDLAELGAMREVFGVEMPPFSSTKALSGHSLGAAGVHEAIYSLLMMKHGFMAGSAHISEVDPAAADMPLLRQSRDAQLNYVLSNSFGFGGTNASLVFGRYAS